MIRGDISCNQSNRYKLYYLHNDYLGSTALVTKVDGTLHTNQGYRAYGSDRINGLLLPTDHKFTGQKLDREPLGRGLYYYGSRYGW